MSDRAYNFAAGPAILPEPVLRRAQADIWNLAESGVGILEQSHRGAVFNNVIASAEENCRKLANIPDDYAVLFLQGGASLQFAMVPLNLLGGGTADYINTGAWSKKAIAEANKLGTAHIASSSAGDDFCYIPTEHRFSTAPAYVHFTSNNTIAGTQFAAEPQAPGPLVCDASSDIFSRPIDVTKYGVVYAGAQKNLGPAGMTLVIIRKDLAEQCSADVPTMLQYRTHIASGSRFNTPPAFGIYVVGEVFKWLLEHGGLPAIADRNAAKAKLIYDYLDNSSFFRGTARTDSRSLMNACFRAPTEAYEAQFIRGAAAAGLSGLKGHRSVGGMRASIYNAMPEAGIHALVAFMKQFELAAR